MRRTILAALVALLLVPGVAQADLAKTYSVRYERAVKAHEKYGDAVIVHPGARVVKKGKLLRSRAVVRASSERMARWLSQMWEHPVPAPAPAVPAPGAAPTYSAGGGGGGGGSYCGLFQFDQGTWESVGGSGSPCAASPGEQWSRAQQLQSERGNSPWPKCGQGGASLEQIAQCESGGDPGAVG